ncbi:MAG: hypothetical protein U0U46_16220 [Saprospiraceae bacterium]
MLLILTAQIGDKEKARQIRPLYAVNPAGLSILTLPDLTGARHKATANRRPLHAARQPLPAGVSVGQQKSPFRRGAETDFRRAAGCPVVMQTTFSPGRRAGPKIGRFLHFATYRHLALKVLLDQRPVPFYLESQLYSFNLLGLFQTHLIRWPVCAQPAVKALKFGPVLFIVMVENQKPASAGFSVVQVRIGQTIPGLVHCLGEIELPKGINKF